MSIIRSAWHRIAGRRRPARMDAVGPATRYAGRAGAYRPLRDQPTVILDTRPLMTRLARQRACSR